MKKEVYKTEELVMDPVSFYNEAIKRVPAYRKFLEAELGSIPTVKSLDDFHQIPKMDKSSYIMQHSVDDLCMDGDSSCAHLWLRSSGTSNKPFFWPRRYEDEINFPKGMHALFKDYVAPEEQPTLVVVGLALGPWGTGMQSSFAFRTLAQKIPGFAVVSPGLQNQSILEVLEQLSPKYKRTLLMSYPPFAKIILEEAEESGIDIKSLNIHCMVGGEGITESYRERMWKLLGYTEKDLNSVWSLYGSTDFANVGFENVLTIAIRRYLAQNNLSNQIFGEPDLPMLFQRVPSNTYFENIDGELVVSRIQGIPLIRYRSGDHIRFIEKDDLLQKLKDSGFDAEQHVRNCGLPVPEFKTPFVALYGRIDQTIFFYGANIGVEQVKAALNTPVMEPFFNGRFFIKSIEDDFGNPQIEVSLEENEALKSINLNEVSDKFAVELAKVQSEFREVRKLHPNLKHVKIVAAPASIFELGWKTRHM